MTYANRVLELAYAEVGTVEQPVNKTKYGAWNGTDGQPWCGAFVRWVFAKARVNIPNCTYTPAGANEFRTRGTFHTTGQPRPGDVIFFDFPGGMDRIEHVGIVVKAAGDFVFTIEGNTSPNSKGDQRNGGQVSIKKRSMKDVKGWGRPPFSSKPVPLADVIVKDFKDDLPDGPKPAKKATPAKTGSAKPAQVK